MASAKTEGSRTGTALVTVGEGEAAGLVTPFDLP